MRHTQLVDDVPALADFLGTCAPLDTLARAELERAARGATVGRYTSGELIMDAFADSDEGLYIVWEGRVDLWSNPDRLRELPDLTVGPQGLFGYVAALVGEAVGPRAVAADDAVVVRLAPELVNPAFATRRGARVLAQEIDSSRRHNADLPSYTLVDDLIVKQPLIVRPEASIADVAGRMEAARLPYAAIVLPGGGYGIVTDATLRRVVAAARPVTLPVTAVMATDPPVVRSGASAAEALIAVLESEADVVLVVDRADGLTGALVPRDFAVSSTTAAASLHEQVRRASTTTDLEDRFRRVPAMLTGLMARGLAADRIITVHSAIVDSLVRRALELVMADHPGLAADRFTWVSLGSNGRREAVLSSDIDAAVSFDDDLDVDDVARYLPMFLEVTRVLERAGLHHDRHGVNPALAKFARRHADWADATRKWLAAPAEGDAVILISLLVDGRPIHGDTGLPEIDRVFRELRRRPRTMSVLLSASIAQSVRRRRALRRRVNLKKELVLPIANIARWAALIARSPVLPTTERLLAASGSPMLSRADGTALADAFRAVQDIRLTHQLEQVHAGDSPDDIVSSHALPPVDRAVLAEASRVVASSQRRMSNMAAMVLPELEAAFGTTHFRA